MKITSPSGQVYTWNKDTPPTEEDIAALVKIDAERHGSTVAENASVAPTPAQPVPPVAAPQPQGMTDAQRYAPSNLLPASAGLMAGQPRGGVPVPEFVKSAIVQGGPPAVGQTLGAFTGPLAPVAIPAFGAIGGTGGYLLDQMRTGNAPTWGGATGAAIAGAIPGGPMARGVGGMAKAGLKYGAGNLVAKAAETGIDEGRLPTVGEGALAFGSGAAAAPIQKVLGKALPYQPTERERTLAQLTKAYRDVRGNGVVLPPAEIGKDGMLSTLAGKAATGQEASIRNQSAWQKMSNADLNLPASPDPILPKQFAEQRVTAYEPYETIKKISNNAKVMLDNLEKTRKAPVSGAHAQAVRDDNPATKALLSPLVTGAAADVDKLKIVRFEAQQAWNNRQNPEQLQLWMQKRAEADKLSDAIEAAAETVGDKTLLKRLRESREFIARSHAIEAATGKFTGLVDPAILGAQLEADVPLSGNAQKIANFYTSWQRAARTATNVPAPGVNALSGQMTGQMMSAGTPEGVALGILNNYGPKQARNFILSEGAQNRYARPPKGPTSEEFQAMLARFGGSAQGRQ